MRERDHRHEMSAITDLFAGVPVSDLDVSIDWYTRFFGRPADRRVGDEVLWEIDEHATLFIEPNAAQAGAGRITLAVTGLDVLLERLAAQRIEHEPIETYSERRPTRQHPRPGSELDRVRRTARHRERVTSIARKDGHERGGLNGRD